VRILILLVLAQGAFDLQRYRNLGKAHYERGEYALAASELEKTLAFDSVSGRDYFNLGMARLQNQEEDRALALLAETHPALRGTVPEPDLRRLLRRQLAILKYVEFRFRPQVRVSDDDVRKAWEEEQAGNPAGPALEDEQEAIRARLERKALDERIEVWVAELRARADVRYVCQPPPGP